MTKLHPKQQVSAFESDSFAPNVPAGDSVIFWYPLCDCEMNRLLVRNVRMERCSDIIVLIDWGRDSHSRSLVLRERRLACSFLPPMIDPVVLFASRTDLASFG